MNDLIISREEAIETLKANYPDACFEQLRDAVDVAISALKQPEIIHCKDCKHYHEDIWGDEIGHPGIPIILGHEMCDFWGSGCKTRADAFCSFAERRTKDE